MRRRFKKRRITGNTVIHVPSTMGGTLGANTTVVIIIASPSLFAGGSASNNIEAQDKDRTVNLGHHVGRLNVNIGIRNPTASGQLECTIQKVERQASTPVLGTFPIPTSSEVNSQGMQQVTRLNNPGKVFHWSRRQYTSETGISHNMVVSPSKYRLSKMKAGDHWVLLIHNRGTAQVTFDCEMRYKEYE